MCGITGLIGSGPPGAIERMTDSLLHRGPDEGGFYRGDGIVLGQRRLSINDIEGGHQPIANESGTLQLVCNGEIYNSPELRERLEAAGHVFRTRSDVEVILHLYEDHGDDCVRHLRGMFAFALWDIDNRRLLLARDPMGQKPLFFCATGGAFLFASEVKAILASGMVPPEIDLEGLWHYVSMRFIPDQYSLFRGIRKLPAASTLAWENDAWTLSRYWQPDFRRKIDGDEKEIEERLDALLRDTVKLHLLSDVRVGAYLSGGIDSSTVAAIMAEVQDEPVPAFSIGVREQSINELPWARQVVRRYRMEGHERIAEADLIHLIPSMIHHMDEPSDPFGVGVYLVARLASEHVKVVLSGDGGDENFAGYDRFAGQRFAELYGILPAWFRRRVMTRLIGAIPESFGYKTLAQKARWLNDMSFFDAGERYVQSMSFLRFTQRAKESLFTRRAQARIGDRDSDAKILAFFNADNVDDLVDRMLYTDLMTRMPDHLLVIADRMNMAHSIENRSPLVDHRVVEFAASIPAGLKLRNGRLKYILRKVAARYLPDELINRPKQGFGFPIARWMRTDLRVFMQNLFRESRFVELGLFERGTIDTLLREHLDGRVDHNFRLWILLNLELWYRLYFEGENVDSMRAFTDRLMNGDGAAGRNAA